MKPDSLDDTTLLRMIAQAQPEALGELYDRYGRLVYSVAYNATSDASLAEEITQDTFLRVWQKAESYHPHTGKVAGWLAGIARHRAIDLFRRRQARGETHMVDLDALPNFDLTDEHPDPEKSLEAAQNRRQVRQALRQLPDDQRQTLALAYFKGLTQEQIASVLDVPLGTVKTRVRLGMQKLRKYMESSTE